MFWLYTDVSELGAAAVLSQDTSGSERVIGYATHRRSKAGAKCFTTEEEVIAVFEHHRRPYLSGRKLILVTDCSALTWLFKNHSLPSKRRRWAVRLTKYCMDLRCPVEAICR